MKQVRANSDRRRIQVELNVLNRDSRLSESPFGVTLYWSSFFFPSYCIMMQSSCRVLVVCSENVNADTFHLWLQFPWHPNKNLLPAVPVANSPAAACVKH